MSSMRKVLATVACIALAAAASSGCGDDGSANGGPDRSDPAAVVVAFVQSYTQCGDQGAGLRAELTYPESAARRYRERADEERQPGGCEERPAIEVDAVVRTETATTAEIEVSGPQCGISRIPAIEVDGTWFVDASRTNPDLTVCNPYS